MLDIEDFSGLPANVQKLLTLGQKALDREEWVKDGIRAVTTKTGLVLVSAPGLPKGGIRLSRDQWVTLLDGPSSDAIQACILTVVN